MQKRFNVSAAHVRAYSDRRRHCFIKAWHVTAALLVIENTDLATARFPAEDVHTPARDLTHDTINARLLTQAAADVAIEWPAKSITP